MKILVCIAQVPDTTAKIAFTDNNQKFDSNGVTMIINPYDEWYALVRALELKEAGIAQEVHILSVGDKGTEAIMRKALSLGGDQAYRIDLNAEDPYLIAQNIAEFVNSNDYQLILTGKESIDYANAAVPSIIAGLTNSNYVALATSLEVADNQATVTRAIEGGSETCTVALPLVVSCQKGMSEARIPNMRGIMAARTKPLNVIAATATSPMTEIVAYEMPPAKEGVKLYTIDQIDELVAALHNDAKVL